MVGISKDFVPTCETTGLGGRFGNPGRASLQSGQHQRLVAACGAVMDFNNRLNFRMD